MDFPTCQSYFQKLVADSVLPPKMEAKLYYLQSAVVGKEGGAYLKQLPEFQQESLRQMNSETQKAFFVDIINCFASSETRQHFKDVKVKLKRVGSKNEAATGYLTAVGNRLAICKRRENGELWQEFQLENIEISSLYQRSKKRYVFTMTSGKKEYEIRFEEERTCARIHGQLWNLVKQFKSPQERRKYEKIAYQEVRQQETAESAFDQEAYFMQQERNYLIGLKKTVDRSISEGDGTFKLLCNINHGKLQVSASGSVRLLLFVQRCEIRRYIESFILLDCWNTQVESFRILKHIRPNTYLAYILLKKINIWTAQREAYVSITYFKDCPCLEGRLSSIQQGRSSYKCIARHYIIINSVQYGEAPQNGFVRMNINQIAEFSEIDDKKDNIFLCLTSNMDPKTYDILVNKVDLNANFLKEVPSLNILYKEKAIQNSNNHLFDFNRCACNLQKLKMKPEFNQQKEEEIEAPSRVMTASLNNMDNIEVPIRQESLNTQDIIKIISDEVSSVKNERIIEIIKKKLYERYYLRLRFNLETDEEPYIQSRYALNHNTDFLLQSGKWKFNAKEEYVFIDEEELKMQKGMLKLMIKQITSNILAGKSIMTMSLPVQIFGIESLLEGVARCFGFLPKYMHDAVQTDNPVQQIKNVAAAFMFLFACRPRFGKPFNPILGETFQGEIGGIPIFVEQISHHPPISAFYIRNDKFQAYGNFDMHIDMGLNTVSSKNHGLYYARIFATDTRFVLRFPQIEVGGLMMGDRTLGMAGRGFVLQTSTNTYLEYSVGKQKKKLYEHPGKMKACQLLGGVFKVTKQFTAKAQAYDIKKTFDGAKPDDIVEKYSHITGKWFGDLFIDGVEYKSLKNGPFPLILKRQTVLLPSDSLFREDIIYKRWGDNKRSNEQKEILQNLQRRDRKLRGSHK